MRRILAWMQQDFAARGIESARLDAELLLAKALDLPRMNLYLDLDRPLAPEERSAARDLVQRRRTREPVAYILGERAFYKHTFVVSPAVLVPRPDTETLVERALARLEEDAEGPMLDVGTGSGCIGLSLLAERPELVADLVDLSPDALDVARRNAERLAVAERARFLEGDLLAPAAGPYALITSNPPYLREDELGDVEADVRDHEPHLALVAGVDGLEAHRRLAAGAGAHLRPGGALLLEVGAGQAQDVKALLASAGFRTLAVHRDLGGVERVVEGTWPGA